MKNEVLHEILSQVEKPSQYLGNEVNVIKKDFDKAKVKICLIFPDKYEMGMSHVGLKILYDILNKIPDVVAERCFAPELDLEEKLREKDLPLFSLESKKPLHEFDIIGFSFTYELTYTNFLNILDLGKIPLWQKERANQPLIIGGGGCMMNAEPIADFLDVGCLGDGEELIIDIIDKVRAFKELKIENNHLERENLLSELTKIEGIYIPSFFKPEYFEDGRLKEMIPLKEGYTEVKKRVLQNLDQAEYPTKTIVPSVRLIHDRIGIEIQRGCNRACRFCQAGYIDRPVRQRSPQRILEIADQSIDETGIEDLSLLSLSAADYGTIVPLLKQLNSRYQDSRVAISVPATRTEKLSPELLDETKKVRRSGFTVAPEAGTERMRRVINKGNKVEDLFRAVENAFSKGWRLLKLYYMVGLPFEMDEDVEGIANEANQSIRVCKKYTKASELKLGASSFVPKPHTPFQWEPQMTIEETKRKYHLIRKNLRDRKIRLSHHHPEMSYLEGLFSRGDRKLSQLLYIAFKDGLRFDEWKEHFDFEKWQLAIEKWGEDPAFYLHRARKRDEVLPWDHLFSQMDKNFLWEELERAHDAAYPDGEALSLEHKRRGPKAKPEFTQGFTEDCSLARCSNCGVCDFREIKNRSYVVGEEEIVEKKGHREWYGWNGLDTPGQIAKKYSWESADSSEHQYKIRVRFSKKDEAVMMGHLELMGSMRRALRRLKLPVAFSQGFHPQIKLALSHPLPVGISSQWEYFDLQITKLIDLNDFLTLMNQTLPRGIQLLEAKYIDKKSSSLYANLDEVIYDLHFPQNGLLNKNIENLCQEFEEKEEFLFERVKKTGKVKVYNMAEYIEFDKANFPESLKVKIKVKPEGSLKPTEVLSAILGLNQEEISRVRIDKVDLKWKELLKDFGLGHKALIV